MNKSFKVVFNKARGALMVVNEVTSSVQAKGTKTVIATAVALVAGAAVAAPEISTTPDAFTTLTKEKGEFAGKLWVSASGEDADATGLEVKGEGVELTTRARSTSRPTRMASSGKMKRSLPRTMPRP